MTAEQRADRTEPRRASSGRTALLVAMFAVTLVAATVSWVQVVTRLRDVIPLETRGTPAAIVWSDRVFRSEAEFARWLRGRGISYERWVRTHPTAVAILRRRDRAAADAPAREARARNAQTAAAATTARAPAGEVGGQELTSTWTAAVVTVMLAATLACGVALGAAVRSARRSRRREAQT